MNFLGSLALSRAVGDFEYKQGTTLSAEDQIVTCNPEIKERKLIDNDEFLVLACDGMRNITDFLFFIYFFDKKKVRHEYDFKITYLSIFFS